MKRFFKKIAYIFKYRIVMIAIAFIVLFSILVVHLFDIQIINGSTYKSGLNSSIEKVVTTPATRGRIFDRNGVLLAYDELAYSINISDSGSYATTEEKNKTINESILKTLRIIKNTGGTYSNNFSLKNSKGKYSYTVSGDSLLRFLRDCYGVATVSKLSDKQKSTSADDLVAYLVSNYEVATDGVSSTELIELLYLRVNMTANSYTRYLSFNIANEISNKTMTAILENIDTMTGITVDETYVRKYNDAKYYSALIGYTGVISDTQLSKTKQDGTSYESTDIVGKSGIEQVYEEDLAGTKGSKSVYLDTVGHITQVISQKDSIAGKDVYLTIDSRLQKKLYDSIENQLITIIKSKLKESGSKYEYSDGYVSEIYIMMPEVYTSLIKNNLVKLSQLESPSSDLEKTINSTYESARDSELSWLKSEMTGNGTAYSKLSDKQKNYVWRAYEMLVSHGVINTDRIDTSDDTYKKWIAGEGTSLKGFLEYAISKDWVDTSLITSEQYTDLSQILSLLVDYTQDNLKSDRDNALLVYQYLIEEGTISGTQMCLLLYDQGYLSKKDDLYDSLKSGSISGMTFISDALTKKILTPGELGLKPSSGGGIVEDPSTGQLLALVSYPGYDSNKLTGDMDVEYYNGLQYNSSSPMLNWATQATCAPGSIFKLCTAISALETGVAKPGTTVTCSGLYTEITPSPKCWIYPGSHGTETMPTAIRDSCNIYFYTMGNLLARSKDGTYVSSVGTDILKKYAEKLGLATKSGIEIPEADPQASDTDSITSAIGQGTATYSCVNIARYISTITNEGTCYNSSVVLKITDNSGNVISETKPVVASKADDISDTSWSTVKEGMKLATSTFEQLTSKVGLVAAKTGTSQPSLTDPDNATFVSYAPISNPEITLSLEIPYGYTSINNTAIANDFYNYYFGDYSTKEKGRKGLPDYSSYVDSKSSTNG